jgi:hypothetical protein
VALQLATELRALTQELIAVNRRLRVVKRTERLLMSWSSSRPSGVDERAIVDANDCSTESQVVMATA